MTRDSSIPANPGGGGEREGVFHVREERKGKEKEKEREINFFIKVARVPLWSRHVASL